MTSNVEENISNERIGFCFLLSKVTVGLTGNSDEIDVLQHVKETAVRSKEMQGELNLLKAKIYNLENDVRHN